MEPYDGMANMKKFLGLTPMLRPGAGPDPIMCLPERIPILRLMSLVAAIAILIMAMTCPCSAASRLFAFDEGVGLLLQKSFAEKEAGIDSLAMSADRRVADILPALLEGQLFFVKKDKTLVYGEQDGGAYRITSVLTGEQFAPVKKRKLKKISINNRMRNKIKTIIAHLDLSHQDPKVRLMAVNKILNNLDPATVTVLTNRMDIESDPKVRDTLAIALAVADLQNNDLKKKEAALTKLKGRLHPAVRLAIIRLLENEQNETIKAQAGQLLRNINARISFFEFFETLFFGLSAGSVLVLAAIGLAITFGVIGVINMAHGELIMLGAYTTYVIQQLMPGALGISLFIAIPAAFVVSGLTGIVIEKSVIRFLYGRPLETLLATFGISLVLQQTVRSIFSPLNRIVETPAWMSGSVTINSIFSLTINRISVLLFCLLVFTGLYLVMKKTSIGLRVRAVSQNRSMARAMGVRAARVDALTFGLGSGIAGIAGVALSQLTNVGPNLGQAYIIDSFMVVVFGGVGNLWGTMLGGLFLGVANKFLEPWTGAVLAKIIILVFIIIFIQKRPVGLFPQKGRAASG